MSVSSSRSPSSSPIPGSPASPGLFNSSGQFSPLAPASVASCFSPGSTSGMETVIFESYLQKTPPLRSFIMKWTKRWFVLSRSDPSDPSSIELSYFRDASKKEKRQSINLSQFVGIRPNAKVGTNEHVFAIETEERKYILKAPDQSTKNVWLAKLCELCGQEQVYHITIPQQPAAMYSEAILKFSSPANVTAVLPSNGKTILEIPFGLIRRMGCLEMYSTDVVWFETCKHSIPDNFLFFTVPSGTETAQKIVRELKAAIEIYTSVLLILEDSNGSELSFISREHYGCQEFSSTLRNRTLQSGLHQLAPTWKSLALRRESELSLRSASSDVGVGGVSLEDWAIQKTRRKMSVTSMKGPQARKPTLDKFRQASVTSFERMSPSLEPTDGHFSDSGFTSDVFEPPQTPPRTLSQQNSVSSQHSSHSSLAYSPAVIGENPFNYEEGSVSTSFTTTSSSRGSPLAPIVPPRSIISLRQDSYVQTLA